MLKVCRKCNISKETRFFHKNPYNAGGLFSYCKDCKRLYDLKYRKSEKVQSYYKSKKYKKRKKEYRKKRQNQDPRIQMLVSAKVRAKQLSLPINISIEDIIVPKVCPLLEIPLFRKPYGEGGSFCPNSPSLDRIIPSLGYVKGNIRVISMKANAMKYNATPEELKVFCSNILIFLETNKEKI